MYPEYMEIDGIEYKINTDYRYALACFKALEDDEINDIERAYALVELLLGCEVENMNKAIEKITYYLCCGKENKGRNIKKDMDFEYDRDYIYASFMSDYGIDLENTEMHWWKYCSLISGLTEQSILNKIRDIRNTDLNDYKDAKTRAKLKKAMDNVALPHKQEKIDDETRRLLDKLGIKLKEGE